MDSIGVQLKNARTRQGLSLDEVSGRTKIPVRALQAIESDDFGSVDSAFFYRSFTTQFARCVGLDAASFAEQLSASCLRFRDPLIPGQQGDRTRPDIPGLAPKQAHKTRWVLSVVSLVIMLGACSTLYTLWENSRTASAHAAPVVAPAAAAQNKSASPQATASADALNIKLSAVENTWLSLVADGHEVFKGTLHAEESKTLQGQQTAQVRARNAGGVEVVFNGKSLGKLGPEGQGRTVVFTRDSYNVLHAGIPTALATLVRVLQ